MPFETIDHYHAACRAQIGVDASIGIQSLYLPNTYFSQKPKPKYCLIAAEPSLGGLGVAGLQRLIDCGMTNFLHSRGDFVLQYCAYEFLCDRSFSYVITDLAKGAMAVNNANVGRTARYDRWLPVLRDEIQFYGNPVRVALGRITQNYLALRNLPAMYLRHYSQNNYGDFNAFWNKNVKEQHFSDDLDNRLREFMKKLFQRIKYPKDLQNEALARVFNTPLPNAVKGMFLEYRQEFRNLRADNTKLETGRHDN